MLADPNDKQAWVENANDEVEFVSVYGKRLGVILNPAKVDDRFAPDLYSYRYNTLADVKKQQEPFRKAMELFGIAPERCVTVNVLDVVRYAAKHGGVFLIYFWLQHPENANNGVYASSIRNLVQRIVTQRRMIHQYQTREQGGENKTHSFVISLDDLTRIA